MHTQRYVGLDYSLGQGNFNKKTGIHYGVISQNSVNLDKLYDSQKFDYGDPTCPDCGNVVLSSDNLPEEVDGDWNEGKDYACPHCKQVYWSDAIFFGEPLGWHCDDAEYSLTDCLDSDIFVLRSPYYTFAQYCSPCVPGAGNLDNPADGGVKCYALGPEWFDKDSPMPYPLYRVSDNQPC